MNVLGRVAAASQRLCLKVFVACTNNINNEVPPAFVSRYSLSINRRHVDADIATFVDETLRSKMARQELIVRNPELLHIVKRALVQDADGMYVISFWADFSKLSTFLT
jgi:hypothetical protein